MNKRNIFVFLCMVLCMVTSCIDPESLRINSENEPESALTDPTSEADNSSTNYAPSNVKDYKFVFTTSFTTYIYFTSNSTVNTTNSYISKYPSNPKITSATYTKTSNNKATIVYRYTEDSQTKTETVYLTFTSYSGGKLKTSSNVLEFNFTCTYLGTDDSYEAPSSVAYKKFTVGYGYTWYQFGSQSGSSVTVSSSSESSSIKVSATYSKSSSTAATLTIIKRYDSSTVFRDTYSLSFLTSTSGTYTRTSSSSYASSTSGSFTLQ